MSGPKKGNITVYNEIQRISGNMKVDIPWTSLFSASVVVRVEDVYMLAGPVTDRSYDPERERALQNAMKRQILESMETENAIKAGLWCIQP